MKKTLSIILALALVMGLAIPAFAAEAGEATLNLTTKSQDIEVNVTYKDEAGAAVYSVDVEWTSMDFTYTRADTAVWDPSDHSYKVEEGEEVGTWSNEGKATVTVTNHSNAAVNVEITATDVDGDEVTVAMEAAVNKQLDAGVEDAYDDADSVVGTVTITGEPEYNIEESAKVGTVTVTIAEVSAG